ncbi:MAG: hypothetical protein K6T35_04605, partial [Meiothermus silvanus]|nr:hypothetical protein [Allomeiothermus silvanus]
MSWAAYCILGWSDPPEGLPELPTEAERRAAFFLHEANKIRLQYCEDAQYYARWPAESPTGPETGTQKVIRGGSWADCAEVVTVSFRASWAS